MRRNENRKRVVLGSMAERMAVKASRLSLELNPADRPVTLFYKIGMEAAAECLAALPDEVFRCWRNERIARLVGPVGWRAMMRATGTDRIAEFPPRDREAWLQRYRLKVLNSLAPQVTIVAARLLAWLQPEDLEIEDVQMAGLGAAAQILVDLPYDVVRYTRFDELEAFLERFVWVACWDLIDEHMAPPAVA